MDWDGKGAGVGPSIPLQGSESLTLGSVMKIFCQTPMRFSVCVMLNEGIK